MSELFEIMGVGDLNIAVLQDGEVRLTSIHNLL